MSAMTIERGETITLGRKDYGWGVPATVVTVDGEPFAEVKFKAGPAYFSPCGFCSPAWSGTKEYHLGVMGGVCFQCTGRGSHRRYETLADVERLVKRRKSARDRAERKRAAADAAHRDAHNAWMSAHPDLAVRLAEIYEETRQPEDTASDAAWDAWRAAQEKWGGFIMDLASRSTCAALSEKQTTAVAEAVAKADARVAAVEEKQAAQSFYGTVGDKVKAATGTVVVRARFDTHYGYGSQYNALLVIEGTGEFAGHVFKAAGTGRTLFDAERGDEVEVSGTIKAHDEYKGTPQTVLTRATVKVTKAAEEES